MHSQHSPLGYTSLHTDQNPEYVTQTTDEMEIAVALTFKEEHCLCDYALNTEETTAIACILVENSPFLISWFLRLMFEHDVKEDQDIDALVSKLICGIGVLEIEKIIPQANVTLAHIYVKLLSLKILSEKGQIHTGCFANELLRRIVLEILLHYCLKLKTSIPHEDARKYTAQWEDVLQYRPYYDAKDPLDVTMIKLHTVKLLRHLGKELEVLREVFPEMKDQFCEFSYRAPDIPMGGHDCADTVSDLPMEQGFSGDDLVFQNGIKARLNTNHLLGYLSRGAKYSFCLIEGRPGGKTCVFTCTIFGYILIESSSIQEIKLVRDIYAQAAAAKQRGSQVQAAPKRVVPPRKKKRGATATVTGEHQQKPVPQRAQKKPTADKQVLGDSRKNKNVTISETAAITNQDTDANKSQLPTSDNGEKLLDEADPATSSVTSILNDRRKYTGNYVICKGVRYSVPIYKHPNGFKPPRATSNPKVWMLRNFDCGIVYWNQGEVMIASNRPEMVKCQMCKAVNLGVYPTNWDKSAFTKKQLDWTNYEGRHDGLEVYTDWTYDLTECARYGDFSLVPPCVNSKMVSTVHLQ